MSRIARNARVQVVGPVRKTWIVGDLFAHFSEVQGNGFKSLQEAQKVSFEVKQGPKGKQAGNIKPL